MLNSVVDVLLHLCFSEFETAFFQVAFSIIFFALLRVGEVVDMSYRHVTFSNDAIKVFLKHPRLNKLAGIIYASKQSNGTML